MSAEPTVRVIPYFSPRSKTTSYVVARGDRGDALIVDPVHMDRELYEVLLAHELELSAVLITHPNPYMERGIRTIEKIFRVVTYAGSRDLPARNVELLSGDQSFQCCGLHVNPIAVPPHSRSSIIFHLHTMVFSGPIVHAGTLGDTPTAFAEALLVATIKDFLFTLPDDTLLLPSVGPPSTLGTERDLSPYYRSEA